MLTNLRVFVGRAGRQTSELLGFSRPQTEGAPGFSIEDAWELTFHHLNSDGRAASPFAQAIWQLPQDRIEILRRDLRQAEASALSARNPRQHLRSEIMDAAAMSLSASHMLLLDEQTRARIVEQFGESFGETELMRLLVMNELRYTVLRNYARFRHNDASDRDWFSSYLSIARRLLEARVGPSARTTRIDDVSGVDLGEYLQLLEKLKTRLIHSPSGRPIDEERVLHRIS